MKRICPVCGKKHNITCHSYSPTRYSIYERITKYSCTGCGAYLQRCKDSPSLVEHIAILGFSAIVAILLCIFLHEYVVSLLVTAIVTITLYYLLGLKDAYYAKKLIPVDENDVPLIHKADISVKMTTCNKTPQKYDLLEFIDDNVILFCVQYYPEKTEAMCYCVSGDISEITDKKNTVYINGKFICSSAEITSIDI